MSKLTTPSGTRGVAFVRVSGDKQDSASQRASIRRWLAQHGVQVHVWYEDVGSRHEAYKRPEFQRLMAAVRADEIDWVVVDSKDRFGTRDSYEFGRFASELRDNDVELWSVAAGCLTADDYATEILTAVDSVRSRDEQLERSRRAVRGMVQVWESGRYNGAYPPQGFDAACLGADGRERWRGVFEGHGKRAKVLPDGRPWVPDALADAYRAHATQHLSGERAELAALGRRYEEATERYLEPPHRARAVVRGKLDELESRIAVLEDRLRPLDEEVGELREELAGAQDRVRADREAGQGVGNRQKAQALAGVPARIVCHFEHDQSVPKKRHTAGQKGRTVGTDRSRLERAVFEPPARSGTPSPPSSATR